MKQKPPIVAAWNLQNPENIGAIIRLCGNFNVEKLFFINENLFKESRIKYTASTAFEKVAWKFCSESWFIQEYQDNFEFIAAETSHDAQKITQFRFPDNCVFLLGNESYGLPDHILEICSKKYIFQ